MAASADGAIYEPSIYDIDAMLIEAGAMPGRHPHLQHDCRRLMELAIADRVGLLARLKEEGMSMLSSRQKFCNALARHHRRTLAALERPATREKVLLLIVINVHEYPAFIEHQLDHVAAHVPDDHRIVLNCNAAMYDALEHRPAFLRRGKALRHPVCMEKRTFHGSLLQGIVRNIDLALRRYDFESLLVLSSRSWFRRPITLEEVRIARAQLPFGVDEVMFRFVEGDGYCHVADDLDPERPRDDEELRGAAAQTQPPASFDWHLIKRTLLATEVLQEQGHPLVSGPHEGLLLSYDACMCAVSALDGDVGKELFSLQAPVEEFALQSLAESQELRFAQLGDMGRRGGLSERSEAGARAKLPPLTKTVRREQPSGKDAEGLPEVACLADMLGVPH
jgi:hypothetical protein